MLNYLNEPGKLSDGSVSRSGLVVIILVLGLAAALIPFAAGYIDLNNLSMTAAGMEWYYVGFGVLGLTVIGYSPFHVLPEVLKADKFPCIYVVILESAKV